MVSDKAVSLKLSGNAVLSTATSERLLDLVSQAETISPNLFTKSFAPTLPTIYEEHIETDARKTYRDYVAHFKPFSLSRCTDFSSEEDLKSLRNRKKRSSTITSPSQSPVRRRKKKEKTQSHKTQESFSISDSSTRIMRIRNLTLNELECIRTAFAFHRIASKENSTTKGAVLSIGSRISKSLGDIEKEWFSTSSLSNFICFVGFLVLSQVSMNVWGTF